MNRQSNLVISVFLGHLSLAQAVSMNRHKHHRAVNTSPEHSWKPEHWTFMNETEYRADAHKDYDNKQAEAYTPALSRAAIDALVKNDVDNIIVKGAAAAKSSEHVSDVNKVGVAAMQVSSQDTPVSLGDQPQYYDKPAEHMWKPESWKYMNEKEWLEGSPEGYNKDKAYTPVQSKEAIRAIMRKQNDINYKTGQAWSNGPAKHTGAVGALMQVQYQDIKMLSTRQGSATTLRYGPRKGNYTPDQCTDACPEYKYFAIQKGVCACDSDLTVAQSTQAAACNKDGGDNCFVLYERLRRTEQFKEYWPKPADHMWKPESWKFMNETEWINDDPEGYKVDPATYTPILTKPQVKAMMDAQQIRINAEAKKEHENAVHLNGYYKGWLAQQKSSDNKWDIEHFKHMNETAFISDAPDGYKEQNKYTPVLTKAALKAMQEQEKAEIVAEGAKLAVESSHHQDGHKQYAQKEPVQVSPYGDAATEAKEAAHGMDHFNQYHQKDPVQVSPYGDAATEAKEAAHGMDHFNQYHQYAQKGDGGVYIMGKQAAKESAHGQDFFNAYAQKKDITYPYRKSAWNHEQMDNSNEVAWDAETKSPTHYQFKDKKALMQTKRDYVDEPEEETPEEFAINNSAAAAEKSPTQSYLKEYVHGDHAWTTQEETDTDYEGYHAETQAPTGYQARLGALSQVRSGDETYPYRKSAWNHEQMDNSNEVAWDAETKSPTHYQFKDKKALMQTEPTASYMKPYDHDEHAWSGVAHHYNEKSWDDETKNPTGYQKALGASQKSHPGETNSRIEPYVVRDHAWNGEQHDASHSKEWHAETEKPSGYQVTPTSALMQYKNGVWVHAKEEPTASYMKPYDHDEHAWTGKQGESSDEKSWEAETEKPSGYQKALGALGQHPGETNSTLKPYVVRDHAWNGEQHDASHSKEWHAETEKPTGYQVTPTSALGQHPGETNSTIKPYVQRDHSWNHEQRDASHEKNWDAETKAPSGYQVTPTSALMQYKNGVWVQSKAEPEAPTKSYLEPYVHSDHAWTGKQGESSDEKSWDAETQNPTGYQKALGASQKARESHSYIADYHTKDHAWNHGYEQLESHNTVSLLGLDTKATKPSVSSLINGLKQSIAQTTEKVIYPVETNSKIIPYVVRDHSWTAAQHDRSNFYDMRDDAPDGYKEHITYLDPHPTNQPYLAPITPEACVEKAQAVIAAATTSAEMTAAKAEMDKCVTELQALIVGKSVAKTASPVAKAAAPPANETKPALAEPKTNATKAVLAEPKINATKAVLAEPKTNATKAAKAALAEPKTNATKAALAEPKTNATKAALAEPKTNATKAALAEPKTNATKSVLAEPKTNATKPALAEPKTNATKAVLAEPKTNATKPALAEPKINVTKASAPEKNATKASLAEPKTNVTKTAAPMNETKKASLAEPKANVSKTSEPAVNASKKAALAEPVNATKASLAEPKTNVSKAAAPVNETKKASLAEPKSNVSKTAEPVNATKAAFAEPKTNVSKTAAPVNNTKAAFAEPASKNVTKPAAVPTNTTAAAM